MIIFLFCKGKGVKCNLRKTKIMLSGSSEDDHHNDCYKALLLHTTHLVVCKPSNSFYLQ